MRHTVLAALSILLGAGSAAAHISAELAPALAARDAAGATEELRGGEILGHPVGKLAIDYAKLVHAGRMDDALALATEQERERARSRSPRERERSDEFVRRVLPRPDLLTCAIEEGGILSIRGGAAFLEVVTSTRREEPDGSVTTSSKTIALPFALENGAWRVAG